ncbi:MAG: hypothetical protein PHI35_07980 [Victivallaceae bacterium]|nr:hypothetical protein [Victivallaceae bacterium]
MNGFKFTTSVPDGVRDRLDGEAKAAEVSHSEWVRRAVVYLLTMWTADDTT